MGNDYRIQAGVDVNAAMTDAAQVRELQSLEKNRIFCDCNGTLFDTSVGETVNQKLVDFLVEAKNIGYEVIIFSDSPDTVQLRVKLLELKRGLGKDFFGEVRHKSEYSDTPAFMVIDDDHSTHKVNCSNKYSPNDGRISKISAIIAEPGKVLNARSSDFIRRLYDAHNM